MDNEIINEETIKHLRFFFKVEEQHNAIILDPHEPINNIALPARVFISPQHPRTELNLALEYRSNMTFEVVFPKPLSDVIHWLMDTYGIRIPGYIPTGDFETLFSMTPELDTYTKDGQEVVEMGNGDFRVIITCLARSFSNGEDIKKPAEYLIETKYSGMGASLKTDGVATIGEVVSFLEHYFI